MITVHYKVAISQSSSGCLHLTLSGLWPSLRLLVDQTNDVFDKLSPLGKRKVTFPERTDTEKAAPILSHLEAGNCRLKLLLEKNGREMSVRLRPAPEQVSEGVPALSPEPAPGLLMPAQSPPPAPALLIS